MATSGLWNFQNYRYIAPALPLLFLPIGVALAPPSEAPGPPWLLLWVKRAWVVAGAVVVVLFVNTARKPLVADMRLFAQGAMDTNTQVVAIGFAEAPQQKCEGGGINRFATFERRQHRPGHPLDCGSHQAIIMTGCSSSGTSR